MDQQVFYKKIEPLLKAVKKPSRYLGGEYKSIHKKHFSLRVVLCFPDLYEIGMSNNAMRIIYSGLNKLDDVFCDRLFTPAEDYAEQLRGNQIDLYGLDSFLPVSSADILGFTVGYELAATNILFTLDLCSIPLEVQERSNIHPIIIAGGPGISNPLPLSGFIDAFWIGEAEDEFFSLCESLAAEKRSGAGKSDLLKIMSKHPAFWLPGKTAVRHIYTEFGKTANSMTYPMPVLKPVQDHGVVEIMRGCPNGCRFCHAGYYYRPCRFKNVSSILEEVDDMVAQGFTTISLSSLSSGDFPGILELTQFLNDKYSGQGISFQLPSLKVESFSLSVIEEISGVRKSSLTFAVETPDQDWQRSINKMVTITKIIDIIKAAESSGYKLAKFYFMLGLPASIEDEGEAAAIIDFLMKILQETKLSLNVTLSTFIPKPHTPYQRASQLSENEALNRIYIIKDAFKKTSRVKITYNSPLMARVEGLIARGDARVGGVLLEAYKAGAIFDAWDDKFNKLLWRQLLEANQNLLFNKEQNNELAWSDIKTRISQEYLQKESNNSKTANLTQSCTDTCDDLCGVCNKTLHLENIQDKKTQLDNYLKSKKKISGQLDVMTVVPRINPPRTRVLCRFQRVGTAAFFAHHDFHAIFSFALKKGGMCLEYTQGFNPMPRLELSEPLPLGFESLDEYASFIVNQEFSELEPMDTSILLAAIQEFLPNNVKLLELLFLPIIDGVKNYSLSSLYWGSIFQLDFGSFDTNVEKIMIDLQADLSLCSLPVMSAASVVMAGVHCIELSLPASGIKEWGLPAIMGRVLGQPLMQYPLHGTRIRQFSRPTVGIQPLSFFDRFRLSPIVD